MTNKYGISVIPDEATRDVAGAPYIPAKLAEKVAKSDIFIADITSIAMSQDGKSLPNPNVTFELGLGAAHLGWDRVVLLFNEEVADFKNLPFDFDRHRISKYRMADNKKAIQEKKKSLDGLVKLAIETIIEQKPLRPRDLEGKSESQIKHDRDVVNLRWFFRHMSVDLLGKHTLEMPDHLYYFGPVMYDGLLGVVRSTSFRLYNTPLEKQLHLIVRDLGKTLEHDGHYRELNNRWVQAFGDRGPYINHAAQAAAATAIRKSTRSLGRRLEKVVSAIRNEYIEVDLDALSREFGREYSEMIKDRSN